MLSKVRITQSLSSWRTRILTRRSAALLGAIGVVSWVLDWIGRGQVAGEILRSSWEWLLFLGPWVCWPLGVVVLALAEWPKIAKHLHRVQRGPFSVRPWSVSGLLYAHNPDLLASQKLTAFLAVKNTSGKLLSKCSVRLLEAAPLIHGGVFNHHGGGPNLSADRGESFLLRWAAKEYPYESGRFLDIPPDDAERVAEILVLNVPEKRANFAAANPQDMTKLDGIAFWFWKLRIKIAAGDGTHLDTEWLASCADDPGPIMIRPWVPQGEEILKLQREGKALEAKRA